MMDIFLHNNVDGSVPVIGAVQRWVEAVEHVEAQSTVTKDPNDPNLAWLVFESYYTTSAVRDWLIGKGRKFIGSVNPDRFNKETSMIHKIPRADQLNKLRSIQNHETEEVYTFRFDPIKNVGKKYCITWGLKRATDEHLVGDDRGLIPAYSYNYKHMFDICDDFNRALHDNSWPHPRGGNGVQGDLARHHDFIMACILQNIQNAWLAQNVSDPFSVTSEEMMTELAKGLYKYYLED